MKQKSMQTVKTHPSSGDVKRISFADCLAGKFDKPECGLVSIPLGGSKSILYPVLVGEATGTVGGEAVSARAVIATQVGNKLDIETSQKPGNEPRYIFIHNDKEKRAFIVAFPSIIRSAPLDSAEIPTFNGHVLMRDIVCAQRAFKVQHWQEYNVSGGKLTFRLDGHPEIEAYGKSLDLDAKGPNEFVAQALSSLIKIVEPQMKAAMALGQELFNQNLKRK